MSIFSFFSKKNKESGKETKSVDDFANLIRVYFQAALAEKLGISNLAALPDLRIFKQTLRIPTQNNKIGIAEKKVCKEMLKNIYHLPNLFFSEIDSSIKKNCRTLQQMQEFLHRFQSFTMDLLTVATTEMSWKARIPAFFTNALKSVTQQTVTKIYEKTDWKDPALIQSTTILRKQAKQLGFSKEWSTNYVFYLLLLAKKSSKKKEQV